MRRGELILILAVLLGLAIAAMLGQRAAPTGELFDLRRSTFLTGPNGAKGLADILTGLGVEVERRRRAWFDLTIDTVPSDSSTLLVLLDVAPVKPLTGPELQMLRDFVAHGGWVFLAGHTDVERCFGVEISSLLLARRADSLPVEAGAGGRRLSFTRAVLDSVRGDAGRDADVWEEGGCVSLAPSNIDTLLSVTDGRAVALRLHFRSGGRAIVLADSRYVSNRDIKETDAGLVVVPWLIDPSLSVVVVDEYHQRFGRRGSLFAAAWRWARSSPAGWAILQLAFAGLVGLAVTAVRFGPALSVITRRRRSPIEHLDALAIGLDRAEAGETAVRLLVSGLRRRLRPRAVAWRRTHDDVAQWLASLEMGARGAEAHDNVEQLRRILQERGSGERVLRTALAVEDVWEALTHESEPRRS